jgi:hypothetical protein
MKLKYDITMKTTALITTILIITLGIYDLVAVMFVEDESLSVSRFLINVGFQAPAFVFATGFVAGHVFGYAKPFKAKDPPGGL